MTGKEPGLRVVRTFVGDDTGMGLLEDRTPADYSPGCRFVVELPAVGE